MSKDPSLVVLDTHIWIWLMSGVSKAVSPSLRSLLEKLSPENKIKVSAISVWEVGTLASKNKIEFPGGLEEWVYRGINAPGISTVDVTAEIALKSTLLPKDFHGDPADRILLATAMNLGATLITHDKEILSYGQKHHLPAISL